MTPEAAEAINWYRLPPRIQEVRRLCGTDVAVALMERCKNRRVIVPLVKSLPMRKWDSPLAALEPGQVKRLARHFGGRDFYVPKCHSLFLHLRNEAIRAQYAAGVAAGELALRFDVTERTIWNIVGGYRHGPGGMARPDDRQESLF